jgi:hypothetical protein
MSTCEVLKKCGKQCAKPAEHTYEGRDICEKHWKTLPKKVRKEHLRRNRALSEYTHILKYVLGEVVKNKRMSYRQMADLAHAAADVTGTLNKKERRDIVKLIITTVRLRRTATPAQESTALGALGELIQDICDTSPA